jgi:hypothetical protein
LCFDPNRKKPWDKRIILWDLCLLYQANGQKKTRQLICPQKLGLLSSFWGAVQAGGLS